MFNYLTHILILLCLLTGQTFAQSNSSGFYIVLNEDKNCKNQFKQLNQKIPLCLSERPFVTAQDFEAVSLIYRDTLTFSKYTSLKITDVSFGRLHTLTATLPKIKLVLVIDGRIIGVFENIGTMRNPIPITGALFTNDVELIQQSLESIIKER